MTENHKEQCAVNCLIAALKTGDNSEKQFYIEEALMALVGIDQFDQLWEQHVWDHGCLPAKANEASDSLQPTKASAEYLDRWAKAVSITAETDEALRKKLLQKRHDVT